MVCVCVCVGPQDGIDLITPSHKSPAISEQEVL